MMKIAYILIIFFISFRTLAQESTRPLELPAFIIEGVEQHNIRSSIKHPPQNINSLTSNELDSLNTFEKQQPTLIPPAKLPAHYIDKSYTAGYINASYGLFNTPEVDAHYRFWADRFDIFASAGGSITNGDALHSNNNKLFLDVRSSYIADEKFFIFGGSNTQTNIFLNTQNYNFYGYGVNATNITEVYPEKDYYDRNLTQAKFEIKSDGTYESVIFSIGGAANYISASNQTEAKHLIANNVNNYYARGFLTIKNYWKNFLLGGNINLNLEEVGGNSQNYYQFDGSASYFDNHFSILLKGGFQIANNSANTARSGLLLFGNIEYRLNEFFTINANLFSGLEKTEFENLITINPYLSSRLNIDHRYDIANIKGSIWYHPNEKVLLSAGANWRYSERNLNFITDTLAEFKIVYNDGIVFDIFGEVFWNISKNNRLIGKISLNMNDIKDNQYLTYMPLFQFSTTYHRNIISTLKGFVTLELTGSRKIHNVDNAILDPYFIMNLGLDYTIKSFNFYIKVNNLFNSDYVIWDRYRERGFFGAFGIIFMF